MLKRLGLMMLVAMLVCGGTGMIASAYEPFQNSYPNYYTPPAVHYQGYGNYGNYGGVPSYGYPHASYYQTPHTYYHPQPIGGYFSPMYSSPPTMVIPYAGTVSMHGPGGFYRFGF